MKKPIVVIESPYAGDTEKNLKYLRACMRDCFNRGEIPLASHALYTQPGVLDDGKQGERQLGIKAGFRVAELCAKKTVVYADLGVSSGMFVGIDEAVYRCRDVEFRWLPAEVMKEVEDA